jgi:hypothetical protein
LNDLTYVMSRKKLTHEMLGYQLVRWYLIKKGIYYGWQKFWIFRRHFSITIT